MDASVVSSPLEWWWFAGILGGSLMLALYVIAGSLAYYHYADVLEDDKLKLAAEHKVCELMRSSSRNSMKKSRMMSYSEPNPVSMSRRGSVMSGSRRMSQPYANAWVDGNMLPDRSVISPSKMSGRGSVSDTSASRGNRMPNDYLVSPRSGRNSVVESSAVLPFNHSTSSRGNSVSHHSLSQRSGGASYGPNNAHQSPQLMENNYVGTPRSGRNSRSPRSVSPRSRRVSFGSQNAYPSPRGMEDDNPRSPRSERNSVVESSAVLPFNHSTSSRGNSTSHHSLSSPSRRPSYGSHNPLQPSQLMENNIVENRRSGGNSVSHHSMNSPSHRDNDGSHNPLQPPRGVKNNYVENRRSGGNLVVESSAVLPFNQSGSSRNNSVSHHSINAPSHGDNYGSQNPLQPPRMMENAFSPTEFTLSGSRNSNPYDRFTKTNEYSPKKYSVQAQNYGEDQSQMQGNHPPPESSMSQNADRSSGSPYYSTSSQRLVQFPPIEDGLGNSFGSV